MRVLLLKEVGQVKERHETENEGESVSEREKQRELWE